MGDGERMERNTHLVDSLSGSPVGTAAQVDAFRGLGSGDGEEERKRWSARNKMERRRVVDLWFLSLNCSANGNGFVAGGNGSRSLSQLQSQLVGKASLGDQLQGTKTLLAGANAALRDQLF